MATDKTLFDLIHHPLRVRMLQVLRVRALTPQMRRVTLGGAELDGFKSLAPEDHVRLFFPRPGEQRPVVPSFGPLGLTLPTLGDKPLARDYTPRRHDAEAGELDIDFFLHGGGVASAWAAQAAPGQLLGVAGPRGSRLLSREFAWQLFVGDETALPEFARRLETLPTTTRALVVIAVNGAAEEQPLGTASPLELRWVHRKHAQADAAKGLLAALADVVLPAGEGFVWLAGEAGEMRRVYRHLVVERELPRTRVHVSGHWKRGEINHDHHEPIELDRP
jgi:NADPH-dependent ferric siderophore reductase